LGRHSIDGFDIVPNASIVLGCQEDQIVPFEDLKDDEQIDRSAGESIESAANIKDSPQLPDLQTKEDCSIYEEEDGVLKSSDQQSILYDSLTKVEQSIFNIEGNQHHFNFQLKQYHEEVFLCVFHDPFVDFLESMSNLNIKTFLSDEDCFCHQLYFCMLHSLLFLGSKSRTSSVNQFLTWLHWKHDFT
jgi:hypothetical protein